MIIKAIAAFVGTFLFMVLFNTSRKELIICGINGMLAWIIFDIMNQYLNGSSAMSAFVATSVVCIIAHFLAKKRKQPVTIYELAGIIPLVPGAGMYQSLFNVVIGDYVAAVDALAETMGIAGAIAVGMLFVASIRNFTRNKQRSMT